MSSALCIVTLLHKTGRALRAISGLTVFTVVLKALYTEPSKSQYSISPLVLVIFKSPTPTVVDTTLVTLVITILPLVITISPLNNPTCTNGRCKLLQLKKQDIPAPTVVADIPAKTTSRAHHQLLQVISGEFLNYQSSIEHRSDLSSLQIRPVFQCHVLYFDSLSSELNAA